MRRFSSKHRTLAVLVTVVAAFGLAVSPAQATDAPPAPTNLEVTDVGWHTVELTWDAPRGDLPSHWSYEIRFLTRGWSDWAGSQVTSHRVSYIQPESTYELEIRVVADGVASKPSNRVTVTTPDLPHVASPTNLEATDVYASAVDLSWDAGSDEPGLSYRVINVTTGARSWDKPDLSMRRNQPPGETHTYEVVAIHDESGAVSEPSSRTTVTTPDLEPPDDVNAVRDGNDVTVSWSRPEVAVPEQGARYNVYDNGVPVDSVSVAAGVDSLERTYRRVASGATHNYTVEIRQGQTTSEQSDPASVSVPPSDDTTPPTPPAAQNVFVYDTATTTFTITEQSTDDTTPQSEIWYESLVSSMWIDGQRRFYAIDQNIPLEFDDASGDIRLPRWIRAVDEAGNRSEVIRPESIIIDD